MTISQTQSAMPNDLNTQQFGALQYQIELIFFWYIQASAMMYTLCSGLQYVPLLENMTSSMAFICAISGGASALAYFNSKQVTSLIWASGLSEEILRCNFFASRTGGRMIFITTSTEESIHMQIHSSAVAWKKSVKRWPFTALYTPTTPHQSVSNWPAKIGYLRKLYLQPHESMMKLQRIVDQCNEFFLKSTLAVPCTHPEFANYGNPFRNAERHEQSLYLCRQQQRLSILAAWSLQFGSGMLVAARVIACIPLLQLLHQPLLVASHCVCAAGTCGLLFNQPISDWCVRETFNLSEQEILDTRKIASKRLEEANRSGNDPELDRDHTYAVQLLQGFFYTPNLYHHKIHEKSM